ncbi:hypothetical protein ACVIHH_003060 [Bradyrhizobium sp. USDA 4518]
MPLIVNFPAFATAKNDVIKTPIEWLANPHTPKLGKWRFNCTANETMHKLEEHLIERESSTHRKVRRLLFCICCTDHSRGQFGQTTERLVGAWALRPPQQAQISGPAARPRQASFAFRLLGLDAFIALKTLLRVAIVNEQLQEDGFALAIEAALQSLTTM